jgi:transmembrane sensor
MSTIGFSPEKMPSREVCADAAAWLTSLSSADRTAEVEEGFRLWANEHPDHATAFQMAIETWDRAGLLYRRPGERISRKARLGLHLSWPRALIAIASVAALATLVTLYYVRAGGVSTAIGEQRSLTLEDGSRVLLNTGTRIAIQYSPQVRSIDLKQGEALFEVAKDPRRAFIVTAGDRTITALGTSFVVRRDEQRLSVTLVEGQVAVSEPQKLAVPLILKPGERVVLGSYRPPAVDRPALDKVVAWQQGQVAFDNTPLVVAIREMNRYSAAKLVVVRPEAERIHVSGVFRAGDSASFARAMAETYRLHWAGAGNEIVLSGIPVMPQE